MLRFHKEKEAECTIAVISVDMDDAPRMGIMSTDENGAITEFEEKPEHPKAIRLLWAFTYLPGRY